MILLIMGNQVQELIHMLLIKYYLYSAFLIFVKFTKISTHILTSAKHNIIMELALGRKVC